MGPTLRGAETGRTWSSEAVGRRRLCAPGRKNVHCSTAYLSTQYMTCLIHSAAPSCLCEGEGSGLSCQILVYEAISATHTETRRDTLIGSNVRGRLHWAPLEQGPGCYGNSADAPHHATPMGMHTTSQCQLPPLLKCWDHGPTGSHGRASPAPSPRRECRRNQHDI